ncbi:MULTISPECIES: hypothetical protein [Actinomycetes]|uniref:hypothetical protein n=1 Tax=Actinomycetes TaxID=1760 RepID=UPI0012FAB030|nr:MULTISPECIES: hypothetical protein [Actinomycetes]
MLTVEWMMLTPKGPAVGEKDVANLEESWPVIESEMRGSYGKSWGEHHELALRQMKNAFGNMAAPSLAEHGEWSIRTLGVSITLTEKNS